jgi:serine protease inhibitor
MKTFLAISLGLMMLVSACKKDIDKPLEMKPVVLTDKQEEVINSSNTFGFDFFRIAYSNKGDNQNFMISPLSVSMALGMTRNGATGNTLDSITSTLRYNGMTDKEINETYRYIIETFTSLDPKVKLSIANSIWYRNGFNVEQDFISTNQNYFNSQVSSLDFSTPGAVNTINSWVSGNTNNLIPTIIDQIPNDMVMYLINAVYFKGQWKYKFDSGETEDKPFYLTDGTNITAPAMLSDITVPAYVADNFTMIELPYGQGNFSMSILLPDTDASLDDLVIELTQEKWNSWKQFLAETEVAVQLPKFKFSYNEEKMKEILTSMGMGIAFDDSKADFTRINRAGGLYISEVKHKTFIETNEEGTEAAAVTSVGIALTSVPAILEFVVNRPFIFLINEKSSGTILFVGAVYNPLSE